MLLSQTNRLQSYNQLQRTSTPSPTLLFSLLSLQPLYLVFRKHIAYFNNNLHLIKACLLNSLINSKWKKSADSTCHITIQYNHHITTNISKCNTQLLALTTLLLPLAALALKILWVKEENPTHYPPTKYLQLLSFTSVQL